MEQWKETTRKEFQDFADTIVWSNDDGSEKYIGVGNMADWWIEKMSQHDQQLKERLLKELENIILDYQFESVTTIINEIFNK